MGEDSSAAKRFTRALDKLGPLLAMVAVWALFAGLRWQTFATWANMQSILLQTAVVGVAALGATMIIISGGIDLSVGSLIALVAVVVAMVINKNAAGPSNADGWDPNVAAAVGVAAGLAIAAVCGLAISSMIVGRIGRVAAIVAAGLAVLIARNYGWGSPRGITALAVGVVVAAAAWWLDRRMKPPIVLSPFIVTLGMWGALRGTAKGLANNQQIYPPQTGLNSLMRLPEADASLLWRPWLWWSPGVWIFLALAVGVAGLLRYTQFGRHIYAIGSNEQTARLCGVHVERAKLKIYTLALLLAGVAGVLQFSFNIIGDPTTAAGYELKVIAAVVIGGASLSGGVGSVLGTVAGALMMTIIDNGCTKVGLEVWMQEILTGVIIVAAVALDQLRHRGAK
jgi:ribose/xylose/arabinose/galactoside ABC-type transport system permease subunit